MKNLRIYVDMALPPDALEQLRAGTAGHELVFSAKPVASVLSKAEPDPQFGTVDIAFGQPQVQAIAEAPRIQWVQLTSAGFTRFDTPEFRDLATRRNLAVTNSSAVFAEPCAVHALSFMLAQARKLPAGLRTRAADGTPAWKTLRAASATLAGDSVLIVGHGAIGRRLVELLRPFDVKVSVFRRTPRGDEGVPVVTADALPAALATADHVMNILPEGLDSRGFFDRERFSAMKSGAIFYNIGRGATVDQDALLEALRSGRVGAAWLDVTTPEPLPDDHPLWAEPNCFITPHVAGGHTGEINMLVRHFLKNLDLFAQGRPLADRIM